MKLEYIDIKLRLELLSNEPPEIRETLFAALVPKLRANFIRFELYFEKEYYQKIILLAQEELSALVGIMAYSQCANVRSRILFYQKVLNTQIMLFGNTPAPQYIINERGLILTYIHSEGDSHLRQLIESYSISKTM